MTAKLKSLNKRHSWPALGLILALLLIGSLVATPALAQGPSLPRHQFYGHAYIGGSLAPEGTSIVAQIGGATYASTSVDSSGRYGYSPLFYVEGATPGSTVNFLVGGTQAPQTATWEVGGVTELDLYVPSGGGTPSVTTNAASSITSTTATLNGTLDDLGGGSSVYVYFEYGTTTAYGTTTTPQLKTSTGAFSAAITSLSASTTYHFRAVVDGGTAGSDKTFTTSAPTPVVTTSTASGVNASSATLNGSLTSLGGGSSADVYFEWGTSTSYGNTTTAQTKTSLGAFSAAISGLTAGTTYHFRAAVTGGTAGSDATFITGGGGGASEMTHQFYGKVYINGTLASSGTTVAAHVNGVEKASTTTDSSGRYGWSSLFYVPGTSGGTVTFYVNNTLAPQTATWMAGGVTRKDLWVSIAGPAIAYSPSSFTFTAVEGSSNPADQTLEIWNSGTDTINWSVADDAAWLSLSPTSGSSTGEHDSVTVSVDATGLTAAGSPYTATITITAAEASNSPQTVSVTLTISETPTEPWIEYSPSSFTFTATEGGSNPATQTLEIWNSGTNTLNWSVADDVDWLSLGPTSGSSTGEHDSVTLTVDITGLAADPGPYGATITITASGAGNTPQTVSVTLWVNSPDGDKLIGADDATCDGGYSGNYFILLRFPAEQSGTINTFKIKAYASGNVKVAIYDDDSGEPGDLLSAVDTDTPVTAGQWNDITISPTSVTVGNYYWLALNSESRIVCWSNSITADVRYKKASYAGFSFPDPAGENFTAISNFPCGLIAGY